MDRTAQVSDLKTGDIFKLAGEEEFHPTKEQDVYRTVREVEHHNETVTVVTTYMGHTYTLDKNEPVSIQQ